MRGDAAFRGHERRVREDEFDLIGPLPEFADEDVAGDVNAAFGFGGEN